jgi:hypothetical protein
VQEEGPWRVEMEKDIGELKTDVATIKANDANTLKELKSISEALIELRRVVTAKSPVWPVFAVGIAGLGLVGAIGLAVVSPISADVASHATELKELYYTLGRIEGKTLE